MKLCEYQRVRDTELCIVLYGLKKTQIMPALFILDYYLPLNQDNVVIHGEKG